MSYLRTLHEISNYIVSSVGLLCNLFMIYIIIKTNNPELKKYNRILLQSAICDASLNIMTIIICPVNRKMFYSLIGLSDHYYRRKHNRHPSTSNF